MAKIKVNDKELETRRNADGHLEVTDEHGIRRTAERADLPDGVETYNPKHPKAPAIHRELDKA